MPMEKLSTIENSIVQEGLLKLEQGYREAEAVGVGERMPPEITSKFADMAKQAQELREKLRHMQLYYWDGESQR